MNIGLPHIPLVPRHTAAAGRRPARVFGSSRIHDARPLISARRIAEHPLFRAGLALAGFLLVCAPAAAETAVLPSATPPLPDVGLSLLRVLGALALVLAIFLGGVWLFRNWQRLVVQRGRAPRLNVIEVRSLGGRHALYVVGYEQERFLIASSPAGVNLLSHLQPAGGEVEETKTAAPASFALTLTQMLKGK
jgi:flagellar biogenesis protein FliO